MYGWNEGRPRGTADADYPSAARLERRRQDDLSFLEWIKTAATAKELEALLAGPNPRWRVVAIKRRLATFKP
jgi:hypothetical protein